MQALAASQTPDFLRIADRQSALAAIVRLTCLAFIITLSLSWKLYVGPRLFLPAPVIGFLGAMPQLLDLAVLCAGLTALVKLLTDPLSKAAAATIIGCSAYWILQDILHFQPYMYMYTAIISFCVYSPKNAVEALRIMVCGLYFWAGFHKLNATFIFTIFPRFLSGLFDLPIDTPQIMPAYAAFVVVPVFECMIGIILFFTPWRRLGTAMAFIMLAVTLTCLGPLGLHWNVIVWPWNVHLFLAEVILFGGFLPREELRRDAAIICSAALFAVAPALALIGLWPSYPAFKLYSGNVPTAEIILAAQEDVRRLPPELRSAMRTDNSFNLVRWTMSEFNTAPYPQVSAYRQGAKGLCHMLSYPQEAKIRVYGAPAFYSTRLPETDYPLCS